MNTKLEDYIKTLPPEEQAAIDARTAELFAEELTLRDLRKARKLTQVKMAKKLKVTQDTISRLENRTDMLLSTLQKVVHGMGGELTIVASFPDRSPVRLKGIGEKTIEESMAVEGQR